MGILALAADERVADVKITKDSLSVSLRDGRTISVPLAWYPRLLNATPAQRKNWKVSASGYGIHWPEIDEDLSTEGLLRGAPAPRPSDADRRKRFKVGDAVRFRYGKGTVQGIVREDRGPLGCFGEIGGRAFVIRSDAPISLSPDRTAVYARFRLHGGDKRYCTISTDAGHPAILPVLGDAAEARIARSVAWWRGWVESGNYRGRYRDGRGARDPTGGARADPARRHGNPYQRADAEPAAGAGGCGGTGGCRRGRQRRPAGRHAAAAV